MKYSLTPSKSVDEVINFVRIIRIGINVFLYIIKTFIQKTKGLSSKKITLFPIIIIIA